MRDLFTAALDYVQLGWHMFPLHGIVRDRCTCGRSDCSSPGKHPRTRHGLKDATSDIHAITSWWNRWPDANIGIATGSPSDLVVVDIDLPTAFDSLDQVIHKLPSTLTALTGGGGVHLFYAPIYKERVRLRCTCSRREIDLGRSLRCTASCDLDRQKEHLQRSAISLRCTTGRLPGIKGPLPGIDLRADGGYIVVPPSVHASGNCYSWLDPAADIAAAPAWLEELPRDETPAAPQNPPRYSSGDGTAYGLAALDNALASLRCAPIGQRNHTLNRVAFSMARLVRAGHLADVPTRSALRSTAVAIGLTDHETRLTIASAFRAGAG